MTTVAIVGGGVVGTMHAWMARRLGLDVVQLDRDAEPRRASVRNFGLVWVSGRARGAELALALRSRELWEAIGAEVPGVGFRPNGSLTVALHRAELAVMEEMVAQPDAAARGMKLLAPVEVGALNPAVRGEIEGALFCERDAVVEPRLALPAVRADLHARGGYRFLPNRNVVGINRGEVVDHTGERHRADLVVLATGDAYHGVAADHLAGAPLRRCRLQMCQTAPFELALTTSIADGDSLRYYPAFQLPSLAGLDPPAAIVARHHMQLLLVQRANGELTIGDTHAYDEPFDFAVEEEAYAYLLAQAERILGTTLPPVRRRWAGVYSQSTDDRVVHRTGVLGGDGAVVVTGLGGRGMTLAPAVAEETFAELGRVIRLAVLDMAGTTVADDGAVERAFVEAVSPGEVVPSDADGTRALEYVRETMGQSKIVVFRALFDGDEEAAQAANRRFEQAFDAAVGRGEVQPIAGAEAALAHLRATGVRVCLTTGFSASTRDRIIDTLGWRSSIDLALSPADAGRGRPYPDMILSALLHLEIDDVRDVAVAGDTTSDLLAGARAGASVVAGVLTGAHTRAELERAPHTHIIDSVADLPAIITA